MNRIFVTGLGVITAIGNSVEENRRALAAGRCGITQLEMFPSRYAGILPCGEIKTGNKELIRRLHAFEPGLTRTTLLAVHAFEEAFRDAGLSAEDLINPETALVGASTVGGMCLTDELYRDANSGENGSEYLASYDCGSVNIYLQERYRMKGIINTINTACSSSANAIMYGARLMKNGLAKRCIVGGTDSLAKYTINGFNALHILSHHVCTPFDRARSGLNLGEGAAFLVLEREEDVARKKVYASVSGFGNANDAYHPSSLSADGEGPLRAMQAALGSAGLRAGDISFVNAHGTATENNDEVESVAMKRLFDSPPAFASTKSNTGHTLGAAGAVEAVYSILNLAHQEVYPSLGFSRPIESTGLIPVRQHAAATLQHVMSNSFGFGGNCTSVIFSNV